MANLHDKDTNDPEALAAAIEDFLRTAHRPAAMDFGENAVELAPGTYLLENRGGRVWIEYWCEKRGISRRVLSIEKKSACSLACTVQRFGGKTGTLHFLDLDRPQTAHKALAGTRRSFAERFRQMLCRQFSGWEVQSVSSAMDLRRSFSPLFPRAQLRRGNRQIAAMACPSAQQEPELLSFALIWFAYVAGRGRAGAETSLALFLPDGAGNLTAHRLHWLRGSLLRPVLFRYNEHGSAGEVDPRDLGNLKTKLGPRLAEQIERPESAVVPQAFPERRLEQQVRSHVSAVDASLLPEPVHGQVITFAAGDRDLIDLLAVDTRGRLAVIELKASEDVHLPIQALDYWMRVRWHAEREELGHLFPGLSLDRKPPRLLLIAPAISFHSSNATVLGYFSPEIEVERVGVNCEWPERFQVVLRLQGAEAPQSHRRFTCT
ncbi:MAG: hypothetical protein ACRD6B_08300 [Bryobacteraceae bacterium]